MCKALHLPNGWKCIGPLTAIQNFVISQILLSFQPLSGAYHELAGSYTSNNPNEVRAVATKNEETFRTVSWCVSWSNDLWTVLSIDWDVFYWQDNNVGLVKQVVSSLYKKNILRLTKVQYLYSCCVVKFYCKLSDGL